MLSTSARLPAAQRRLIIIENATICFAKNSFYATSMEEIAAAAGVTKPVIYQHFTSKRHLYSSLLTEIGNGLSEAIRIATEDSISPHQRVEKGFEAYYRFACEYRAGYEVLFGAGPRRDKEFREMVNIIEEEIANLVMSKIDADIDDNHRKFLALGIISLAEGTVRKWLETLDPKIHKPFAPIPYDETDARLWSKRVTELAWAGLRGIERD